MKKKVYRIKYSTGIFLIELAIAVTAMMLMATIGMYSKVRSYYEDSVISQADTLDVLNKAVANYQSTFFTELVNGTAVPGVTNPYAPTVADLLAKGLLTNFSASNNYGGSYAIQITKEPSGCTAPNCDLRSLTYLTTPIIDPSTGLIDGPSLGAALERLGANAGYSSRLTPAVIDFSNGTLAAMPNPAGVAGILAMRAGYGSSGFAVFTRRDGTLPPTADWNMNSKSLTGINAVGSQTLATSGAATVGSTLGVAGQTTTAGIGNTGLLVNTGNITNTGNLSNSGILTNTGNATVSGALGVSGQTTTAGIANTGTFANTGAISNTGNITNSGTLASGNTTVNGSLGVSGNTATAGITNTGNITNSGNITATGDVAAGRVDINTVVTANSSCAGFNGYQAVTSAGSIASCINGTWQTPSATITPYANCSATTVSFSGCQGTVPATTHGGNAAVSMTYGTGSGTYSCNNGTWSYVSGSCSLPCSSQSVSWSSCTGTASATNHGGSVSVSSYTSSSGSAVFTCNSGSWTYAGGSCTAPSASCSSTTAYWGSGCAGSLSGTSHGGSSTAYDSKAGSASYTCNNGTWYVGSSSCPSTYNQIFYYPQTYWSGGNKYAYITQDGAPSYCTTQGGSYVSGTQTFGATGIAVCWSVNGVGSSTNCTGGANCGPGQTFASCNYWTNITCSVAR